MKFLGAVLLSLALVPPVCAEAAKRTAAHKSPKPDPVTQSYAALPLAERIAIEADLIWTGDYNGIADGDFGERAIAAVKAFQKRNGGKETGVLNPQERGLLAAAAKAKQEAVGWRLVDDQVTGARLGIPGKSLTQVTIGPGGMRFSSPHGEVQVETFGVKEAGTTLQGVLDERRRNAARSVDYTVVKPEFFVLSGLQGGVKKFYERAEFKNGEVRGFTVLYDVATEGMMDRVVVAMSSAYVAFPGVAAGPAVHKRVEYATGILVDDTGDFLSGRRSTDDCVAISIVGYGNADRIANDMATDLALLRVYGGRNLRPVPLAADASKVTDVTVAGVADPQTQGGAGALTTVKARLGPAADGPKRPLEPSPAAGFSGAAAIDESGRLVGMVELTTSVVASSGASAGPQAVLIPVETIRGFLDRQHVGVREAAPRSGSDLAGIARVICTRK